MTPDLVRFLTEGEGAEALAGIAEDDLDDVLSLVHRLRRRFDRERAAAIAETARLRARAHAKFSDADHMLFTDAGLQQASTELVASHRARRFDGADRVADLGIGIGGDARELVRRCSVVGVDIDGDVLPIARHNVGLRGSSIDLVRADVTRLPSFAGAMVFADPARRTAAGKRIFDVERYSPPLSVLVERWVVPASGAAIKVAPGIAHDAIPPGVEAEFVSESGDMRECTLWFGDLRTFARRATLLPAGDTLTATGDSPPLPVGAIGEWIHEPDPAVIRAGLVSDLAMDLGFAGIDRSIAYLTGDRPVESPFIRSFRVERSMPFNLKRLKTHLREVGAGRLVVKKRGSAIDPETLRKRLAVPGDAARVVIVTRAEGRPVAIVATDR